MKHIDIDEAANKQAKVYAVDRLYHIGEAGARDWLERENWNVRQVIIGMELGE